VSPSHVKISQTLGTRAADDTLASALRTTPGFYLLDM
jgi:hypothetical protein